MRVEMTCGGKKLKKKRTSTKKATSNPAWNEALVFNLHGRETSTGREVSLAGLNIELLVLSDGLLGISEPIGRVTLGDQSTGTQLSHWHDLLVTRNAPARWHTLHAVTSVSE